MTIKGRPLKFTDIKKLEEKIELYFIDCEKNDKIPTISGLAVHLDTSREVLCDYEKAEHKKSLSDEEKLAFSYAIKKAKDRVVALQEQLAMKGKINPTVWIFSAKNNLGYVDKKEVQNTGEMTINTNLTKDDKEKLKQSLGEVMGDTGQEGDEDRGVQE